MACPPQVNGTRPSFPSLYNPRLERYRDCEQVHASVRYLESAGDIFRFTLYWTLILYLPIFVLPALWGLIAHFIPHRFSRRHQRSRAVVRATLSTTENAHWSEEQYALTDVTSPLSSRPFLLDAPLDKTIRGRKGIHKAGEEEELEREDAPTVGRSWRDAAGFRSLRKKQNTSFVTSPPNISTSRRPTYHRSNTRPPRSSLRNRSAGVNCLILAIPLIFILAGALTGVVGSLVIGYLLAALHSTAGVRISTWLPLGWAVIQVHAILLGGIYSFKLSVGKGMLLQPYNTVMWSTEYEAIHPESRQEERWKAE